MKRVTIAMDDDLYRDLLNYAADQSKMNVRRLSIGEAVRTLVTDQLDAVGYARSSQDGGSRRPDSMEKPPYMRRQT